MGDKVRTLGRRVASIPPTTSSALDRSRVVLRAGRAVCSRSALAVTSSCFLTPRQATLLDFGFSEARVNKALRETKNAGALLASRGLC